MIQIKDTQDFISRLSHLLTATDHIIKAGVSTEDQTFQDLTAGFLDQYDVDPPIETNPVIGYVICFPKGENRIVQQFDNVTIYFSKNSAQNALDKAIVSEVHYKYEILPAYV